eukprot:1161006-Pelagomonas_calceolata.AAC.6
MPQLERLHARMYLSMPQLERQTGHTCNKECERPKPKGDGQSGSVMRGLCRKWLPSSSSNPLARWLNPVTPTQQLLEDQARLARTQASKKGPAKQKNPVGHPPGDSSVDVACMGSSIFSTV